MSSWLEKSSDAHTRLNWFINTLILSPCRDGPATVFLWNVIIKKCNNVIIGGSNGTFGASKRKLRRLEVTASCG